MWRMLLAPVTFTAKVLNLSGSLAPFGETCKMILARNLWRWGLVVDANCCSNTSTAFAGDAGSVAPALPAIKTYVGWGCDTGMGFVSSSLSAWYPADCTAEKSVSASSATPPAPMRLQTGAKAVTQGSQAYPHLFKRIVVRGN
ncbi:hypothetical protein BD309DRAFT_981548 [Dichomitus squalens]|nr:hypothetical protein BD309DRAFT_981548 [Dichomitus squalens]